MVLWPLKIKVKCTTVKEPGAWYLYMYIVCIDIQYVDDVQLYILLGSSLYTPA